jgi:hypothetical protein
VGLYEVTAEDATELSDSDGQQLFIDSFEEMAKELSQEEKEKVNIYLSSLMMKVLDHVYVLD